MGEVYFKTMLGLGSVLVPNPEISWILSRHLFIYPKGGAHLTLITYYFNQIRPGGLRIYLRNIDIGCLD